MMISSAFVEADRKLNSMVSPHHWLHLTWSIWSHRQLLAADYYMHRHWSGHFTFYVIESSATIIPFEDYSKPPECEREQFNYYLWERKPHFFSFEHFTCTTNAELQLSNGGYKLIRDYGSRFDRLESVRRFFLLRQRTRKKKQMKISCGALARFRSVDSVVRVAGPARIHIRAMSKQILSNVCIVAIEHRPWTVRWCVFIQRSEHVQAADTVVLVGLGWCCCCRFAFFPPSSEIVLNNSWF